MTTGVARQRHEHQADRPRADDQHVLAGAQLRVLSALHDARQRFHERRVPKRSFVFQPQQVFLHKPRGHDDGLRVSAVEKQQIITKILLPVAAVKTNPTGRGVGDDDALAGFPSPDFPDALR